MKEKNQKAPNSGVSLIQYSSQNCTKNRIGLGPKMATRTQRRIKDLTLRDLGLIGLIGLGPKMATRTQRQIKDLTLRDLERCN